ncbi:hypothetical protein D3C85_955930 [compost metagenome]
MRPLRVMRTVYEWDVDMWDTDGFVQGHNLVLNYREALAVAALPNDSLTPHIVLVCDAPQCGRSRAYVVNGVLPVFFTDLDGLITIKVPERFHKQVSPNA